MHIEVLAIIILIGYFGVEKTQLAEKYAAWGTAPFDGAYQAMASWGTSEGWSGIYTGRNLTISKAGDGLKLAAKISGDDQLYSGIVGRKYILPRPPADMNYETVVQCRFDISGCNEYAPLLNPYCSVGIAFGMNTVDLGSGVYLLSPNVFAHFDFVDQKFKIVHCGDGYVVRYWDPEGTVDFESPALVNWLPTVRNMYAINLYIVKSETSTYLRIAALLNNETVYISEFETESHFDHAWDEGIRPYIVFQPKSNSKGYLSLFSFNISKSA